MMEPDDDRWWLFCGNEGTARIIGPFTTKFDAEENIKDSYCDHDHVAWSAPLNRVRDMVTKAADVQKYGPAYCFVAPDMTSDLQRGDGRILLVTPDPRHSGFIRGLEEELRAAAYDGAGVATKVTK